MASTNDMKRINDSCGSDQSALKKLKFSVTPMSIQRDRWIDTVVSALASEETLVPGPASCRAMLVASAPAALKIPKDKRHVHQLAMIQMLREIFTAEKASWQARIADAQSALEMATVQHAQKMGMKDEKDAELKVQQERVQAKFEAQSKANEVVDDCKEELAAALASHTAAETTRASLGKMKESDMALQEIIGGLKAGAYENPKDLKKNIAAVTERLQSLEVEEALVKTLPQILRRKPEERGSFDEMALQQLDSYVADHFSTLNSKIEATDKIIAEHAVSVTAWEATVEVAEDKKRESDEALEADLADEEHMRQAVRDARKIVKEHAAVVKRKESDLSTEHFGLQYFEEVLEALEFLEEWENVPVAPKSDHKLSEEMAVETNIKVETLVPSIVPAIKEKDSDAVMNVDELPFQVPSPTKKGRTSFGGDAPSLVA
eukprot:gnl/MRDRNA2_/MRDRNA2_88159_c0_seq1.p1 gnl/MRDRNA2_/MRDRNA2_88159_c0~~gnl/MRDRNA2_/MRDRNA2_88159_c0_seq1.p1  ORF type:complete len:434 (+),score=140.08 gnl/MRDRNA2_/MRDRNA2_88159_c0_seq1:80-1381(+)